MIEWLLVHMFLHVVRRSFQEGINSFRKEFALLRANSFLKELIPIEKNEKLARMKTAELFALTIIFSP